MTQMAVAVLCLFVVSILASESDVVVLTDSNFGEKTKEGAWFVEFYAPWCGHCKSLAPTWEKLATTLKDTPVKIAKVDATAESAVAQAFAVGGYPTLKFIENGHLFDFSGKRDFDTLKQYAEGGYKGGKSSAVPTLGEKGPTDVVDLDDKTFESTVNAKASDDYWFVEFYAPWCPACKALTPIYEKLATEFKDTEFKFARIDVIENKRQKERWGITGYPTVLLLHKGRYYEYKGEERTYNAMSAYLKERKFDGKRTFPIPSIDNTQEDQQDAESDVIVLKEDNFDKEVSMGFDNVWFIEFYATWCGHCKALKPVWEMLATQLKPKGIKVGKIEANKHKKVSDRFAVTGFPTLVVVKDGQYYDYSGGRTLQQLVDFASGGYSNVTGAPIAWSSTEEPVTQWLDDENFDRTTSNGDWLVQFGTNYCKACVNFKPAWEHMANKLQGKVQFGYVEAYGNPETTSRFGVVNYPTIVLLSDGKQYLYDGPREIKDIIEFATKKGDAFKKNKDKGRPTPRQYTTMEKFAVKMGYIWQQSLRMYSFQPVAAMVLFAVGVASGSVGMGLVWYVVTIAFSGKKTKRE